MKSFDVVIIGAGLAGLQCAKLLAQGDASVLLVDRKEDLTKGVHTTGIFVRKTFEDFDFPPQTLGKPIRKVTLYSPRLKSLDLTSEKEEFRVGRMSFLYKQLLSECVDSGVEFMNGVRYAGAKVDDKTGNRGRINTGSDSDRMTRRAAALRIERQVATNPCSDSRSIVNLEKQGISIRVKTKVLIGADGARSRVAKDLGLDENREWIVGYEEVFEGVPLKGDARLHCFLDADLAPGYLAWITNDGEESHLGVGGYPSGFNPREALKIFKKEIASKFVNLKNAEKIETRGGRIPVGGVLKRIGNEHGMLIGDAAGAVSPLTAGGLDPCMRLSMFAAEIVAERLKTGSPEVLLNYTGRMFRAKFASRILMRRLLKVSSYQSLLELGFKFLSSRPGRRVAEKIFFRRASFPDVELIGRQVKATSQRVITR